MDFIVRQIASRPDTMLVRYDCSCSCKPKADVGKYSFHETAVSDPWGGQVPVVYATPSRPRH